MDVKRNINDIHRKCKSIETKKTTVLVPGDKVMIWKKLAKPNKCKAREKDTDEVHPTHTEKTHITHGSVLGSNTLESQISSGCT